MVTLLRRPLMVQVRPKVCNNQKGMAMRDRIQARESKDAARSASARPEFDFVMERFGNIRDMDRSFDIEYSQRQCDGAIYRAVWELVTTLSSIGYRGEVRRCRSMGRKPARRDCRVFSRAGGKRIVIVNSP
jgi:hypothetical protein